MQQKRTKCNSFWGIEKHLERPNLSHLQGNVLPFVSAQTSESAQSVARVILEWKYESVSRIHRDE